MKLYTGQWLPHPIYENLVISDEGVVLSCKRGSWIELRQSDNGSGYLRVGVGHGNPCYVHRLVAETFIPNRDLDFYTQVNHLDGDKRNNHVDNLEWVTSKENWHHAFDTGLRVNPPGQAVRIIETGQVYPSLAECARQINGIQGNVALCLLKRRHTHRGFHFEYADGEDNGS